LRWYFVSIQVTMARRSSSLVFQRRVSRTFFLQQGKERFHGGVVAARADLAHRPGQPVVAQQTPAVPRPELAAPVGVHDDTGRVAQCDRVA
jgi:hypothetical protein